MPTAPPYIHLGHPMFTGPEALLGAWRYADMTESNAVQPGGGAGMLYGVTMWIGDGTDSMGPSMAPWACMMR